jgi:hypothetical protein
MPRANEHLIVQERETGIHPLTGGVTRTPIPCKGNGEFCGLGHLIQFSTTLNQWIA